MADLFCRRTTPGVWYLGGVFPRSIGLVPLEEKPSFDACIEMLMDATIWVRNTLRDS